MSNEITVRLRVDDSGALKVMASGADKASKSLDAAGKSARTADRNVKGVAQASANSTKNFSKMAQGISGTLVPAYATLAANVFAITAAFTFFKNAADLRVLRDSQIGYAEQTGMSLSLLTKRVQDATNGVLSFQDAARGVAIGTAAGLTSDQLSGLSDLAKRASLALGRDLPDSFDRLVRGATKAEPELLDELGIILRLEDATLKYADALNLNVKDLTSYQRTQAVTNFILEDGAKKFDDLGGSVNAFLKLGKSFKDLMNQISDAISKPAEFLAGTLAGNVTALAGAFTLFGKGILSSLLPVPPQIEKIEDSAEQAQVRLAKLVKSPSLQDSLMASGKPLEEAEIKALETAVKTSNEQIMDINKRTRVAAVRDIKILRAETEAHNAQSLVGVKRLHASWRAELYTLQAVHGTVMGTMKAATAGFARAANKLLGAAGILGLILTLLGLAKALYEKIFVSEQLLAYRDGVKSLTQTMAEQNQEVFRLAASFTDAAKGAKELERNANLAASISFDNLGGFGLQTQNIRVGKGGNTGNKRVDSLIQSTTTNDVAKANDLALKSIEEFSRSASLLYALVPETAKKTQQQLGSSITAVAEAYNDYNNAVATARKTGDSSGLENAAKALNEAFQGLVTGAKAAQTAITSPKGALSALAALTEQNRIYIRNLREAPSQFDDYIRMLDSAADSVTGLKGSLATVADLNNPAALSGLQDIIGTLDEATTLEEVINKLKNKKASILDKEFKAERAITEIQKQKEIQLRGRTALQAEELQRTFQIMELEAQRAAKEVAIEQLKVSGAEDSFTRIKNLRDEIALLDEQKISVQRLQDQFNRLSDATAQAFESGLQDGLAGVIKGDTTSFKKFVGDIALATLNGMADALAKNITQSIMSTGPATKMFNALKEGGDYIAGAIRGSLGKPGSPVGSSSGEAAESSSGGIFSYFFKKNSGTASAGADASGTDIASKASGGVFGAFVDDLNRLFSGETPFLKGLSEVFKSGLSGFSAIFSDIASKIFGGGDGGILASIFGASAGARYGGVMSPPAFASGGVARGSTSGYPAVLHGTEAVVPLPNNRSIPVDMKGAGQNNNVTVNVSVDNNGRGSTDMAASSNQGAELGSAIAAAVQRELQNQKRPGGMLNRYGVA